MVVVTDGGAGQINASKTEWKEGSHHGERWNLDVCIEKRYHSCHSPLNCIVPCRFSILKKSVMAKKGEERVRIQVKKRNILRFLTMMRGKRVMTRESIRLAVHDNNKILIKYQGVFILTLVFASISAPR